MTCPFPNCGLCPFPIAACVPFPIAAWTDHSVSIHFNGEEIRVIHLPKGHTDGDSIIHFTRSNVFHLGDHFFRDLFPYVDVPSGGNAVGYMENVAQLIEMIPDSPRGQLQSSERKGA